MLHCKLLQCSSFLSQCTSSTFVTSKVSGMNVVMMTDDGSDPKVLLCYVEVTCDVTV